jgi:hypothetical protein
VVVLMVFGVSQAVSADSPSKPIGSGLVGRVVIAACGGVDAGGQSCRRHAAIATSSPSGSRAIRLVGSSAAGRFRVALASGRTTIEPLTSRQQLRETTQTVTVVSHRYTRVIIVWAGGVHPHRPALIADLAPLSRPRARQAATARWPLPR